jgi:hypothetical protein
MNGSGGLPIGYSVTVWRDQADYRPDINLVYERIGRITNRIFSVCMTGSGGLLTRYSSGVCGGHGLATFRVDPTQSGLKNVA